MGGLMGGGKGDSGLQTPPPAAAPPPDMEMLMAMMAGGGGGGGGSAPAMPIMTPAPEIKRVEVIDWREKQDELHKKMAEDEEEANKQKKGRASTVLTDVTDFSEPEVTALGLLGT